MPSRRTERLADRQAEGGPRGHLVHIVGRWTCRRRALRVVKGAITNGDVPIVDRRVPLGDTPKGFVVAGLPGRALDHQIQWFLLDGDDAVGVEHEIPGLPRALTRGEDSIPFTQTARMGITWGRPSGRTVASQ
jgi:hypothetical protein